jgi:hypothetical protein
MIFLQSHGVSTAIYKTYGADDATFTAPPMPSAEAMARMVALVADRANLVLHPRNTFIN